MSGAPVIFDRRAVRLHRGCAANKLGRVSDLLEDLASRLIERLDDTNCHFNQALDIGGRGAVAPLLRARGIAVVSSDLSPAMARRNAGPAVAADEETLPFAPNSFDLAVACLSLHWINDLPGALIQIRQALRPNGLLLASMPVLGTLTELREALTQAEASLTGGAAPRVSPFPELRDCAGLLQRAGYVLPVVDLDMITLSYVEGIALLRDLQAAGESNALALRDHHVVSRYLFPSALALLSTDKSPISVTLRIATMTGWAPG